MVSTRRPEADSAAGHPKHLSKPLASAAEAVHQGDQVRRVNRLRARRATAREPRVGHGAL